MSEIITYSDSIRKTSNAEIVTSAGLKMGLDPKATERIHSLLEANTSGVLGALDETPRQTNIEDTDYYNEFVTIIMKDSNGLFKGFGERDFAGKTYRTTTNIHESLNECGKDLRQRIDKTVQYFKYIN